MKRICIYLTYDKQKIVDKYIGYILKELNTCVDYLVVVCNETEIIKGKEILEKYANVIFYRDNIGFDAGGFKDALCKFIGWKKVLQYDELVLVNDSMFGPFKSMKDIFYEMEKKSVDFWGLSEHGEVENNQLGHIDRHIQSFFLVIGFRMLHCRQFQRYWENMPYYSTLLETVLYHEIKFTTIFANLGYSFCSLADTEVNNSTNLENNYIQYAMISFELITKRNFPFLKKQPIAWETLNKQTQENLWQAINYIDKKTDYDINFIWDNIIRTLNMTDLQRNLHLQYIVSQNSKKIMLQTFTQVVILIFITYKESFEYIKEYIQTINWRITIKILAEKADYIESYQKQGFKCRIISFSEIAKILTECSNYNYVAVLHDTDMTSNTKSSCTGKSYFYNIWENLIKNDIQISGILEQFSKEPRLGFLAPPQPNFENYFESYGKGWGGYFEHIVQIVKELNLNCQLSEPCIPFRITDNFWIRGCILKKLKRLKLEDSFYLPYIWIYLAQDAGYYSGVIESAEYASMNEVNLHYYLQQITTQIQRQFGKFNNFSELKELLSKSSIDGYCKKYSEIFIYGTGKMAKKYKKFLPNVKAYIVSDGQKKIEHVEGIPVKYLSEVEITVNSGIILCLSQENQRQVIPLLENQGIQHYFCL